MGVACADVVSLVRGVLARSGLYGGWRVTPFSENVSQPVFVLCGCLSVGAMRGVLALHARYRRLVDTGLWTELGISTGSSGVSGVDSPAGVSGGAYWGEATSGA